MLSTRQLILAIFTLMLLAALPLIAYAGGWAVVTLDAMPDEVVVEEPFTVGFRVRQHGQNPTPGLNASVTAVHAKTGQSSTFDAVEKGKAGHYEATITLPQAGMWQWHITTWGNTGYPMPDLKVLPPTASSSSPLQGAASFWPLVFGLVAALGSGAALFFWRGRHRPWAIGTVATMSIIGLVGLGSWLAGGETAVVQPAAAQPLSANRGTESSTMAEQGKHLFLAKGCVTCHQHEDVESGSFSTGIGPSLTHYSSNPVFLNDWLRDPKTIKPKTRMPDLDLNQEEITALIAFLNHDLAATPQ